MIDLKSETMFALKVGAKTFPGGERHICTMHRYRLQGIAGIRLECLRLGGRWFTSKESIDRFISELNSIVPGDRSGRPIIDAKSQSEAEESLDRVGL